MRRRSAGLSIIEVLISFTVLTVAILALLGVLPAAGRQGMSTDIQNQALFIAQEKMDEILSAGAFIPPSTQPFNPLPDNPELQMQMTYGGEALGPGNDFPTEVTPAGESLPVLQRVTIQIVWVEQGRSRSLQLVSVVGK